MAESGGGADVRIKLVIDDRAIDVTESLKESLKHGNEELEHGKHHAEGLGSELLKANLYTELFKKGAELAGEGLKQTWEMAEKLADASMEASDEANQQVRASAGLMQLMDRGQHSMEAIRDYARGVREELEAAGTKAGVSTGQMEEMFNRVIERGGRSTVEAQELTEQMALVGKVVPGGMSSLADGFNMMELGIVRARNPLVQLISATGELQGNAKSVAAHMQKMTPAEQIELATKAIEKQAATMKGAGGVAAFGMPTLPELKASFGNIREGILESIGDPLLGKVVPMLTQLRTYLGDNSETIRHYGEEVGSALAGYVGKIETAVEEVYTGAVRDWDKIVANVEAAEANLRDTWGIIMGDSETVHHNLKDAALAISNAFREASAYIKATVEVLKDTANLFLADGHKMQGSAAGNMLAQREDVFSKADQVGPGSSRELDDAIRRFHNWSQEAGADMGQVDAWTQSIREHHEAVDAAASALKEHVESQDTEYVGKYLNSAIANGQEASERFAFNMIAESGAMAKALMDGSIQVDGGFEALKAVIEQQSPELAKKLKALGSTIDPTKGISGHGPTINQTFNGGIHIKQDYRDQDPDRVFENFKRGLARQTSTRRMARTATAFGL